MTVGEPRQFFERDDRNSVRILVEGLEDLFSFTDAMLIIEKYGLSLTFDPGKLEWTATDYRDEFSGVANTPAGAAIFWECKREEADGER